MKEKLHSGTSESLRKVGELVMAHTAYVLFVYAYGYALRIRGNMDMDMLVTVSGICFARHERS